VGPDGLAALQPSRIRVPLLLAGGILGALAFPSTDWWPLTWVTLLPLLLGALALPPRLALRDGWLQGTVFFVLLLRWLDHTFRHYSAIPWPLTWLPIVTLAAYCGLYVGMVAMVVSLLKARLGPGWALATAPMLWVSGEWIRGWLMGGFPWGLLGYSQHRALPVIQIAEVGGVYAVSLLLVAVNAAIAGSCVLGPRRAAMGSAAVAIMLALSIGFGWLMLSRGSAPRSEQSIQISVIQPAIEQGQTGGAEVHIRGKAIGAVAGQQQRLCPRRLTRVPAIDQRHRDLGAVARARVKQLGAIQR